MSRERELLRRLLENFEQPVTGRFGDLFDEVRELLASEKQDQPEPEKYGLGMIGFVQYIPDAGMNFTLDEPDDTYPFDPVFFHPAPQRSFVRLSEEEVQALIGRDLSKYELICAVENMLERKNRE